MRNVEFIFLKVSWRKFPNQSNKLGNIINSYIRIYKRLNKYNVIKINNRLNFKEYNIRRYINIIAIDLIRIIGNIIIVRNLPIVWQKFRLYFVWFNYKKSIKIFRSIRFRTNSQLNFQNFKILKIINFKYINESKSYSLSI